jgi:two-component system NtrC family response regulator
MRSEREREAAVRVLLISAGLGLELGAEFDPDFKWTHVSASAITRYLPPEPPTAFDVAVLVAGSFGSAHRSNEVVQAIREVRDAAPDLKLIAVVGEGDAQTAAAALDAGAWDVTRQHPPHGLRKRLRAIASLGERAPLPSVANCDPPSHRQEMIGTSEPMLEVFRLIRRVAKSDVPVLITGESGSGKELVALAIHERSLRASGPFVPINCAAIPDLLLESELFGHERGAFTGATRSTPGRIEAARGGTLFLDEIGETSPALQVKMLRFLETHEIERVGDRRRSLVDVRVVAATNRRLDEMVAHGGFREDLYYRLGVMEIHLPPLRERAEDVLLMARIFLERHAAEAGRKLHGFTPDAIQALWGWHWPGNVRELVNRIRRAVVVSDGEIVTALDLDLEGPVEDRELPTLREAHSRSDAESVRAALQRARGNRSEAARLLRVSRSTLYDLMRRHRLG